MPIDVETAELIELAELRKDKDVWERERAQREIANRLIERAEKLSGGRRIFHPSRDANYEALPFSTRAISEKYIQLAVAQMDQELAIAEREAERQRKHDAFLIRKAEAEVAEEKRIKDNFAKIIDGDMLPETWEGFRGLPDALKTKLLGELGGTGLITEYKAKEGSGLSWKSWKKLIAFDPNAKVEEPTAPAAPPKEPTEGGTPVAAPAVD